MRLYDFFDRSLRAALVASLFFVPGCTKSKPVDTTNYSSSPTPIEQIVENGKRKNSYPDPIHGLFENLLSIRGPAQVERGRKYTFVLDGESNRTIVFGAPNNAVSIDVEGVKSYRMDGNVEQEADDSYASGFSLMPEVDRQARRVDEQLRPIFESLTNQDVEGTLKRIGPEWALSDKTEKTVLFTPGFPSTGGMLRPSPHCRYKIPITFQQSTEIHAFEFNVKPVDGGTVSRETQMTVSVEGESPPECKPVQTNQFPIQNTRVVERPYFLASIGNLSAEFDIEEPGPRRELDVAKINSREVVYDNSTREKALLGGIMRHLGHGFFAQYDRNFNNMFEVRYRIDRRTISGVDMVDCFQEFIIKLEYRSPGQNNVQESKRAVFSVSPRWKPGEESFFMVFGPERIGSHEDGTGEWFTMEQKASEFLQDFAALVGHCDGLRRRGFDKNRLHPAVRQILVDGEYKVDWRDTLSPEFFSGDTSSALWTPLSRH